MSKSQNQDLEVQESSNIPQSGGTSRFRDASHKVDRGLEYVNRKQKESSIRHSAQSIQTQHQKKETLSSSQSGLKTSSVSSNRVDSISVSHGDSRSAVHQGIDTSRLQTAVSSSNVQESKSLSSQRMESQTQEIPRSLESQRVESSSSRVESFVSRSQHREESRPVLSSPTTTETRFSPLRQDSGYRDSQNLDLSRLQTAVHRESEVAPQGSVDSYRQPTKRVDSVQNSSPNESSNSFKSGPPCPPAAAEASITGRDVQQSVVQGTVVSKRDGQLTVRGNESERGQGSYNGRSTEGSTLNGISHRSKIDPKGSASSLEKAKDLDRAMLEKAGVLHTSQEALNRLPTLAENSSGQRLADLPQNKSTIVKESDKKKINPDGLSGLVHQKDGLSTNKIERQPSLQKGAGNSQVFDRENRLRTKVGPKQDSLTELLNDRYENADLAMLAGKLHGSEEESLALKDKLGLSTMTDAEKLKTQREVGPAVPNPKKGKGDSVKGIAEGVKKKHLTLFDKRQSKLSKAGTLGIKGLKGLNRTARVAGIAGGFMLRGMSSDVGEKGSIDELQRQLSKPVRRTGQKVKHSVYEKGKKLTKRGFRYAFHAFKNALRAIISKIAVVAGGATALLFPLIIILLCLTVFLCTFTGSAESKTTYNTLFNAVQTEYQDQALQERKKLEAKKQAQPEKEEFENISDEDYANLIATQYKPDVVTQYGGSNIDFKAQLAMLQVLTGGHDAENATSLSDLITLVKYWMDQGIVERYDSTTTQIPYEVTWTAKKSEDVSESATAKSEADAKSQVDSQIDAHATDGYSIVKRDIDYTTKKNYETVEIKDEDGKVTGHEQKLKDYTVTGSGTIKLEKQMSKTLTQNIFTLIFINGTLEDYLRVSNEAYANDTKLKVTDLTLGKESSFITGITSGDAEANRKAIFSILKQSGFTDEAASGVIGNIWTETGGTFDPGIVQGGGNFVFGVTGYGLAQWTYAGRQQNLFNHCASLGKERDDLSAQMDFLINVEFTAWNWSGYFNSFEELKKSTDIAKVTRAVMLCYERPADQSESAQQGRIQHAKDTYEDYKGEDTSENTTSQDVGTMISVSKNSNHYGKEYLYEELISNQINLAGRENEDKINEDNEQQIRQLYSSSLILDGFDVYGGGGSSSGSTGGILEVGGVQIDFGSKYYTFNADGINGNPNVCDAANNVGWPYSNCQGLSFTGSWNKMICSSYAAGRYWEVNYPDDPYPLPTNWDQLLTIEHRAPGNGQYSRDPSKPIAKSIISITWSGGQHVAFIEGVGEDGSVVISECNACFDNEYGFRVRKFASLQDFLNAYGGAYLNGMYGPTA